MELKIQKCIIDFFSFFEEFYNTAKTCLKICQNCAISINKLICRCKNIKEAQLPGTPLDQFVGLKAKLLASLHNLISLEVQEIQTQLSIIEELFEKLCHKNQIFHDNCKLIDFDVQSTLVKGTPLQPPLDQLLNFASETVSFGSQVCAQIETSLNVLSFKELNVKHFADNFRISTDWQKRIPEIIAYTSFCAQNQL